jgi:hypothetical protein
MDNLMESCLEILSDIKRKIKKEKDIELLTELEIELNNILENYFGGD